MQGPGWAPEASAELFMWLHHWSSSDCKINSQLSCAGTCCSHTFNFAAQMYSGLSHPLKVTFLGLVCALLWLVQP